MIGKKDADRFHVRKNPRLIDFDYSLPNYYFVTICTWEKTCLFGSPKALSPFGRIARECMKQLPQHFPNVTIDKWVVIPNHVHAIIVLNGGMILSSVVGSYKSAVTKQIHEAEPGAKIWQSSFHDHIVRNQADYERIWSYIDTNPGRWMDDCFYTPQLEE